MVWRERAPATALALALDGGVLACVVAGDRGRAFAASLRLPGVTVTSIAGDQALPEVFAGLMDLTALDAPTDDTSALAAAKRSLFVAQRARPTLLRAPGSVYVVVVDSSRSDTANAIASSTSGLLKTAALEWPGVRCALVDTSDPGSLAAELAAGLPDLEVRTHAGVRTVPVLIDEEAGGSALGITRDDVLVCSGGARGVTATTLLALARAAQPRLLLLGRTRIDVPEPACCADARDEAALKGALITDAKARGVPLSLPAIAAEASRVLAVREIVAFLAALRAAGSTVRYAAVDVRDAAAVGAAVAEARTALGPVTGIVHGAGVLADKRIEDKTAEQVDRVMDTKVLGLVALLSATSSDPLKTLCLFSSVAGRFGNIGQVDYAMANEALTQLGRVVQARRAGVRVKSLMWGPWEGGMVTPALKKQFLERGVAVLSHADGARHFVDELRSDTSMNLEVVFGGELGVGPTATDGRTSARFLVDDARFGVLTDHAIADVPVLPVVFALELMLRTRRARVVEDLRVLRGVRLPRFAEGGHTIDVAVDAGGAAALTVDGGKQVSYAARLVEGRPTPQPLTRGALEPYGFSRAAVYDTLLFHGPRFQLVDDIIGASAEGLVAQVRGVRAAGWHDGGHEPWVVDVAALDAALQATLLWARHGTGGAYLPTSVERFTIGAGIAADGYRCVVAAREAPDLVACADVVLVNGRGEVAYRLEGVRVHRLADDAAFSQPPTLVASDGARA